MIVVAIIALLAAIAVPNFLRARKRAQATQILEDLRLEDAAIDQYAIETNKGPGFPVQWADAQPYLKKDTPFYNTGRDMFNNTFPFFDPSTGQGVIPQVDARPCISVQTFSKLSDVAPSDFWSPYFGSGISQ